MHPHDVLDFDPVTGLFVFVSDSRHVLKIRGIRRVARTDGTFAWAFPACFPDGFLALKDFKAVLPHGRATPAAIARIEYLKSVPDQIAELRLVSSLDHQFKRPLYKHQLTALEYMLHYPRFALLLEQGLGKTAIAINYLAIQAERLGKFPALVLAPRIVLENWEREVAKFSDLTCVKYAGEPGRRARLRERILAEAPDLVVTNYEAVVARGGAEDFLFFKDWAQTAGRAVILDEASRVKGHKSQRTRAVAKIAEALDYRYLMSGTLCLGDPCDVYAPFTILNDLVFGADYYAFERRYCSYAPWNRHVVTGYKHLDEMKRHMDPYLLSLTREECVDLPRRVFTQRFYALTAAQRALYNQVVRQDVVEVETADGPVTIDVRLPIVKLNKLQQILSGFLILPMRRDFAKCNACPRLIDCIDNDTFPWQRICRRFSEDPIISKPKREYVEFSCGKLDILREDLADTLATEKAIIWVNYQKDLENVAGLLGEMGVGYVLAEPGSDLVFEADETKRVYLGQVSQGIGTTLNSATCTYYYSYSLKLEDRLQSLDRNYRLGQTKPVLVKDFLLPGSVEAEIVRLLSDKKDVKEFVQAKVECRDCTRSMDCFARGIYPFAEGCELAGARELAETRKTIKLKELKP